MKQKKGDRMRTRITKIIGFLCLLMICLGFSLTVQAQEEQPPIPEEQSEEELAVQEEPSVSNVFHINYNEDGTMVEIPLTADNSVWLDLDAPLSDAKEQIANALNVDAKRIEMYSSQSGGAGIYEPEDTNHRRFEFFDDNEKLLKEYLTEDVYIESSILPGMPSKMPLFLAFRNPVEISKVDENGNFVSGAQLAIQDSKGNIVEKWESSNQAQTVYLMTPINGRFESLFDGIYTLTELVAPSGYIKGQDVSITLTSENDDINAPTQYLQIVNQATKVRVNKVDEKGNFVSGATLQIIDSNGQVICEFETGDQAIEFIAQLDAGQQYTLHEKVTPQGYQQAQDLIFTVNENGDWVEVEMVDQTSVVPEKKKETPKKEETVEKKREEVKKVSAIQTSTQVNIISYMVLIALSFSTLRFLKSMKA